MHQKWYHLRMAIRNVVFDLGKVMINYNPRSFIEDLGYGKELGDELCNAIFLDPVWQDMDKGIYMSYEEALPVFIERHPNLEKEIRHFFEPGWMDVYTVKEDTEEILFNWVHEKGLNIYVLSNYSADGFAYIYRKHPFFRKISGYVVSAYEKCVKPDPKIYLTLLERYGLKPEECVFIDDLKANIDGARAVGMEGILFNNPNQAKEELQSLLG